MVVVSALFFLSGSAALIYEVLWMKELGLLFGNSAQAAAASLTAFFTGIAAGNAVWGRRTNTYSRPLFVYGVLELCVTVSAMLYFAVYVAYDNLYPFVFGTLEQFPTLLTLVKFVLALLLFFPAAFFMGGTLPVMTQYFVRTRESLGKHASVLYAINTLGAACGSIAAGFYLPQALGIEASYFLAMAITFVVGLIAIALSYQSPAPSKQLEEQDEVLQVEQLSNVNPWQFRTTIVLAALSGFVSLALQVLWIRMFVQVLHNSVYTYSAILATFLIALALGGVIARELARRNLTTEWLLPMLLTLTALLISASPVVFNLFTNGGAYIGGKGDFHAYLWQIVLVISWVIGVPTLALGVLLPYLFKLAENAPTGPGETVGRLVTVNTIGAIIGSFVAGFILLDWIGLWPSIRLMAVIYILAAFWLLIERPIPNTLLKLIPVFGLILIMTVFDTSKIPVVKIDPIGKQEALLKVWQGSDATVAVVRRNGHLRTKLNNWYTLGSTGDMATQQMQTHLPMLLHPQPKSVFFLGLGTGITAGTVLDYPISEAVVTELAPSAIKASEQFFTEYTNGLYTDPRVTLIAEDGRNVLRGSTKSYDLIISDMFIPWKAGSGVLYSVEHYQTASSRLKKGGIYAQWLPLYQLTRDEFAIIARSMLEVFPMVTMWRGNFRHDRAVVALIGHQEQGQFLTKTPLLTMSKNVLTGWQAGNGEQIPLLAHYAGNLEIDDDYLTQAPLNTDDRPIIEYLAPINHRQERAGQVGWFVGKVMFEFTAPYLTDQKLTTDPYLTDLNQIWFNVIQGGYYFHLANMFNKEQHQDAAVVKNTYESLFSEAAATFSVP